VIDARVLAHTVVNNRQRDTMPFVVDPGRLMAPPVARSALDRHEWEGLGIDPAMPLAPFVAPATAASDFRAYGPLNMAKGESSRFLTVSRVN
jgi:hypothetical protein